MAGCQNPRKTPAGSQRKLPGAPFLAFFLVSSSKSLLSCYWCVTHCPPSNFRLDCPGQGVDWFYKVKGCKRLLGLLRPSPSCTYTHTHTGKLSCTGCKELHTFSELGPKSWNGLSPSSVFLPLIQSFLRLLGGELRTFGPAVQFYS